MTVYAELVFIENFAVDYLIITLSARAVKAKAEHPVYASLLGALYAVFLPIFPVLSLVPLKILLMLSMMLLCFIKSGLAVLAQSSLAFISVTSCLYGITTLVSAEKFSNGFFYSDDVFFIIPMLSVLFSVLLCGVSKPFFRKSELNGLCASVNFNGKTFSALIDTGNSLCYSNLPVLLVNRCVIPSTENTPLIIPYESVGAKGALLGFKADDITITYNNRELHTKCVIALCDRNFGGNYSALMHPDLVKECV